MTEIPLNKFEKRDLVIKLHKEGKTYREIAHIARISPRDIKLILKKYERQLENKKRKENNQEPTIKKLSLSSQAFILFQEGKKLDDVKVLLDIPFKKAMQFWVQYLKSIRMFESFEFYQIFRYQIPELLTIGTFIRKNQVDTRNIANVLREAKDVSHLQSYRSEIKNEIEGLKQVKNNYLINQNTNYLPLLPLGLPEYSYHY